MSEVNVSVAGQSFSEVPPPSGFEDAGDSNSAQDGARPKRRSYRRSTNRMSIPPLVGLDETRDVACKGEVSFRDQLIAQAPVIAEAIRGNLENVVRGGLESAGTKMNVDRIVQQLMKSNICDKALEGYCEDSNPDMAEDDFRFTWRSVSKLREESECWQGLVNKTNDALRAKASLASVLGENGGDVHEPTISHLKRSLKDIKDLDELINARRAILQERINIASSAVETRTDCLVKKEDMIKAEMKD